MIPKMMFLPMLFDLFDVVEVVGLFLPLWIVSLGVCCCCLGKRGRGSWKKDSFQIILAGDWICALDLILHIFIRS
jgi:hypothetical protein